MAKADFGNWHIEWLPEDGARISVLKYAGNDLLTSATPLFRKPENNYGEYELRPVYGYDDCFPTVKCIYPGESFECSDHGELYLQKWEVITEKSGLTCSTVCPKPESSFIRTLEFAGNNLTWHFEVKNRSEKPLPFLHVMHSLMPLNNIKNIVTNQFVKIRCY